MIEYYDRYILPTSPLRSKLAIHLNAQDAASNETPTVTGVLEQGKQVLGLDNKDSKDQEASEAPGAKPAGNGTVPFIITDVREFKSMMPISPGPRPVKHISEFEDLDAKL